MKIALKPNQGNTFSAAELGQVAARWLHPEVNGRVTARCSIRGEIKELTLELDEAPFVPADPTP
jgi:hypothetical protein